MALAGSLYLITSVQMSRGIPRLVPHFVVVDPSAATIGARASGLLPPPKLLACVGALVPRKFCQKIDRYAVAGAEGRGKLY
jgi:hypothetical protein